MVMCSRGQVTGEDGSTPSPGAVTNASSGPIFVVEDTQCQTIFPLHVKILFLIQLVTKQTQLHCKKEKRFSKAVKCQRCQLSKK